jgi:hypothetical protein
MTIGTLIRRRIFVALLVLGLALALAAAGGDDGEDGRTPAGG